MNDTNSPQLSEILRAPQKAENLLPLVYEELRKLAWQKMAQEKSDHTLQATALVHEAYLRILGSEKDQGWENRRHFFAAAAEAMRRILIEQARHKQASKAGGKIKKVPLVGEIALPGNQDSSKFDLLALDEALQELERVDSIKAQLVKLRYFTGASLEESSQILNISPATAKRYWVFARSWLFGKLKSD